MPDPKRRIVPRMMSCEPYNGPDPTKRHRYQVLVTLTTPPIQPGLLDYVKDALEGKLRPTGAPHPVRVEGLAGVYQGAEDEEPARGGFRVDDAAAKATEGFLLHLVDVVWQTAHEDESVPDTDWAARMIEQARGSFTGGQAPQGRLLKALDALGEAAHHDAGLEERGEHIRDAMQHIREALAYARAQARPSIGDAVVSLIETVRGHVEAGHDQMGELAAALAYLEEAPIPDGLGGKPAKPRTLYCGPNERPEWAAWREYPEHDLAPVDAFYAGWREAMKRRPPVPVTQTMDAQTNLAFANFLRRMGELGVDEGLLRQVMKGFMDAVGPPTTRVEDTPDGVAVERPDLGRAEVVVEPMDIPDVDIKLTSEEVRAKPRRFEHKDGSPVLYPRCIEGDCPVGECNQKEDR